jgi:hypothetical protein
MVAQRLRRLSGGDKAVTIHAVTTVLRRALEDPEYRRLLENEPDRALHGYDISYQERAAIISGDAEELERLGLSPDLSTFANELDVFRDQR